MSTPRPVGINHVALEVDDIEQTLTFWRRLFDVELRGVLPGAAFIDLGDQFIALFERGSGSAEQHHFGLVVDDKQATRATLEAAGAEILPGRFLDFLDPSGNRVQVVEYGDVQFTKDAGVLQAMGLDLGKSAKALAELRAKGIRA